MTNIYMVSNALLFNKLSSINLLNMAEHIESEIAKRRFTSKIKI
jgi:hypothetical protein